MVTPSASRRRSRSVRVTLAAAFLAFAALVLALALPTQSPRWLSVASVTALICGLAASRIVHNELAQNRVDAMRDRVAQARAFHCLFTERADEHADLTQAMTDRLAGRERVIGDLEAMYKGAHRRAIDAQSLVRRESRRADQALRTVAELQVALEIRTAEEADELASWESGARAQARTGVEPGGVAPLRTMLAG